MFWEKKEKEQGLPDLPRPQSKPVLPSRELPPIDMDDGLDTEEIHELPSFPDSPIRRGFSQSAIKEAVSNDEIRDSQPLYQPTAAPPRQNYKFVEMDEWQPQPQERMRQTMNASQMKRDNKPIFIRIDKFQLARNSLETVKTKLNEIEELLKTIRDVKSKEDAELSSWESEMENVKSRVQNVLTDIFERVEE